MVEFRVANVRGEDEMLSMPSLPRVVILGLARIGQGEPLLDFDAG